MIDRLQSKSILNQKFDRTKYSLANPKVWETLSKIKKQPFVRYRELLKRAEAGEILTDFPVEILIKTTLNCNHFCPKCLHGKGVFPQGNEYNMKFETLKMVLDEGKKKGLCSVVFTGGEPTMHPQLIDFVAYAGKQEFPDISLITNGSLLSDKLIDCILDNGVTRVNVSLDSTTPETFINVRGINDYDRVTHNIERLLARRDKKSQALPILSMSFVLSEENVHELDDFIEKWENKADGGIKIYPYKNVFSIVDEEFSKTYGPGKQKVTDFCQEELPNKVSHFVPIMNGYSIECTIPWYRCHVGINGELQACTTQGFCDHPEMIMGNIHDATFEDIWKSEKWDYLRYLTLKKRYDLHAVCRICQKSI